MPVRLLVAAATVALGASPMISQTSIAGARLGLSASSYQGLLGKPTRVDNLEGGLKRLVFGGRKLEVYFRTGKDAGVGIATWNKAYRTSSGVGPCSPVTALKKAYGAVLKPVRAGSQTVGYRLGALTFATTAVRVTSVTLGSAKLPAFAGFNVTECS